MTNIDHFEIVESEKIMGTIVEVVQYKTQKLFVPGESLKRDTKKSLLPILAVLLRNMEVDVI